MNHADREAIPVTHVGSFRVFIDLGIKGIGLGALAEVVVETDRLALDLITDIRLVLAIHAFDHAVAEGIADLALPQIGVVVFTGDLFLEVKGLLLLIDGAQV